MQINGLNLTLISLLGLVVKTHNSFYTNPGSTPDSVFFFIRGDEQLLSKKRIDCISRDGDQNAGTFVIKAKNNTKRTQILGW